MPPAEHAPAPAPAQAPTGTAADWLGGQLGRERWAHLPLPRREAAPLTAPWLGPELTRLGVPCESTRKLPAPVWLPPWLPLWLPARSTNVGTA